MRNVATVRLSFDLLGKLMCLPKGQRVARAEYDITTDCVRVLLEGDGLPARQESCVAQELHPTVRTNEVTEMVWPEPHKVSGG